MELLHNLILACSTEHCTQTVNKRDSFAARLQSPCSPWYRYVTRKQPSYSATDENTTKSTTSSAEHDTIAPVDLFIDIHDSNI